MRKDELYSCKRKPYAYVADMPHENTATKQHPVRGFPILNNVTTLRLDDSTLGRVSALGATRKLRQADILRAALEIGLDSMNSKTTEDAQ